MPDRDDSSDGPLTPLAEFLNPPGRLGSSLAPNRQGILFALGAVVLSTVVAGVAGGVAVVGIIPLTPPQAVGAGLFVAVTVTLTLSRR